MSNKTDFTPIKIDDADAFMVAEYGYYCQEKFELEEVPLSFEQWQDFNNSLAD